MVNIFLTTFEQPLTHELLEEYYKLLPPDMKERNIRFIRWQDRHSHLLGKLLLLKGLNITYNILEHIQYNFYQRPFISSMDIDFNISHSGKYVLCAIGEHLQVGVDIEEIKKNSLEDFKKVMTSKQWDIINNAPEPYREFYKFWTIKESVIKADGRGLSIPLDELEIDNNTVNYDGRLWYIAELNLDSQYAASIATNKPCSFRINTINFYKDNLIL
jgi:4'-phosphopantetheinyl transferase